MESNGVQNGAFRQAQKKPRVVFDDEIPDDGPELFMLRIKGNQKFTMNVFGKAIRGIFYHWHNGSSEPHYEPSKDCPGCKVAQNKKWKGYLHVYCVEMRQEVFLELTAAAAKSLKHQLGNISNMRGQIFQIKRTTSDNGRLFISILGPHSAPENLPPEKDPRPSLLALYGFTKDEIFEMLAPETDQDGPADFS
jgi:hypothetical protein